MGLPTSGDDDASHKVAPKLVDYHLHTWRCGHALGEPADYVEWARALGLTEIGFADHLPLWHTVDATLTMSWDDFPLYLADIKKLKAQRQSPRIKLGVEVDWLAKFAGETEAFLADYDFDFILGAVHFVDGWGIDDRRYLDQYNDYRLEDLYERYFESFVAAAKSGIFDIMAHPDLIKKYFQLRPEPVELYERVVEAVAKTGVVVELSSAGLRKPCREAYPGPEFLRLCRLRGVPVTLGSDAHAPEQVGFNFRHLLERLKEAGYDEIASFNARKREMVKIDWSLLERLPTT